ncbi:MAG: hypothetical protein ACE5OS_06535 [Anaerolineae bacterium]
MTFTASDLDDSAAVVFFELTLPNRNRFYATVSPGGNTPEEIHVCPPAFAVKSW